MLASETVDKPRLKPSEPPAEPPAPDALAPELLTDEMHRAAAERNAPWQVRHASRVRLAALVGITAGIAGLALYGWNTLRPTELDKLQITLPARTSAGFVAPAAVLEPPPPPAVVPTATVQPKVQPAPPQAAIVPTKVQPAPAKVQPSGSRTTVTHLRRGDASTPAAAAVAAPVAFPAPPKPEPKPDCAEGVAALGLCK